MAPKRRPGRRERRAITVAFQASTQPADTMAPKGMIRPGRWERAARREPDTMAKKKKGSPGERERQPFQLAFNIHQLAGDVAVFYDKDNAGGVVLRSWDKTTMDQVEICIGNIPVDIDLISFYHFIDKLAEGECSQIRFNISYGSMHLAVATISAKTASETARRIDGKTISGVSKLLSRTLFCHLACEGG